jgi:hypothetical protein
MSDDWKDDPVMAEVAAMKEAAWAEVAHLPLREAIRERLRLSAARSSVGKESLCVMNGLGPVGNGPSKNPDSESGSGA